MVSKSAGSRTLLSERHSLNVASWMTVTPSGISICSKDLHPKKAPSPILDKALGRCNRRSDSQSRKASLPISASPSGNSNSSRDEQPENAPPPISITSSGIAIVRRFEQPENIPNGIEVRCGGSSTSTSPRHAEKTRVPRSLTPRGTVTSVIFQQPANALVPKWTTLPGISTEVRLIQL